MTKKLLTAILAASLCIPSAVVSAEESADVSARLAEVDAQIQELKAERRELRHQLDNQPVYEDDYIRVWFDNVGDPEYSRYAVGIHFTIENKSDASLEIGRDELSVDGFMVDEGFIDDLSPHKKLRAVINLEDSAWTVDNTKDIEMSLHYRDKDGFDYIYTDVFELD